jgi:hypothetical protein
MRSAVATGALEIDLATALGHVNPQRRLCVVPRPLAARFTEANHRGAGKCWPSFSLVRDDFAALHSAMKNSDQTRVYNREELRVACKKAELLGFNCGRALGKQYGIMLEQHIAAMDKFRMAEERLAAAKAELRAAKQGWKRTQLASDRELDRQVRLWRKTTGPVEADLATEIETYRKAAKSISNEKAGGFKTPVFGLFDIIWRSNELLRRKKKV